MGKINVNNTEVNIVSKNGQDYVCLTDMIKAKDGEFFVSDWMRNRNTLEFLSIWERINNQDFNYGEFAIILAKQWKEANANAALDGFNMRDHADIHQLIVLSNLENQNAYLISKGMTQSQRLLELRKSALSQLESLRKSIYTLDKIQSPLKDFGKS